MKSSPRLRAEADFTEVIVLIQAARQRASRSVNKELVGLYWQIHPDALSVFKDPYLFEFLGLPKRRLK